MKKYLITLSVSFVFLLSCSEKKNADITTGAETGSSVISLTDAQIKSAGVAAGKMEQKTISSVLKVNGKIDVPPQNMVSISIPMGGYLKSTHLLPGVHVSKGEVIAVVEDQQYIQVQQDYLTAKAKIRFLENEYERQKELNQSKASSDKVYQQAEADYSSQRVMVAALAEKLKLAGIDVQRLDDSNISRSVNIYSPINGYVSKVNVNIGKYVAPTDVLFELINPTDIHLALKVFEKDINKLFIGQKLMAYTNNQPEKKYPCEILLIGKDLSPERNTDVHCHFEMYDKSLIPGTYMNAEIAVETKNAFVLPESAVLLFENKTYVFVIKEKGLFEMLEVKTGPTEKGVTEIFDGAELQNKSFVVKGAYAILMKLKNTTD
ncbi:MAG: efflux RND transporter periplasmic adaptor subunit [Bacteroidetes bacterium]|nr:efflux RND transporter periplasmic adaptor subunit [Bacteroidota bacterium]